MKFEDKICYINDLIKNIGKSKKTAIWGGGEHTAKLFEYTNVLNLNINYVIDKYNYGYNFFGFKVEDVESIDFCKVDCVIISSFKYQEEIVRFLVDKLKFKGQVLKLYNNKEKKVFYKLPSNKVYDDRIQYIGNYKNWGDAQNDSGGYDSEQIFKKVVEASKKVVNGECVYERDSVLFYKKEYSFNIITPIIMCASVNNSEVNVIDFGGSLGSTYFQNREFLKGNIKSIKWNILEQNHFVKYGRENIKDKNLEFHYDIDKCFVKNKANVLILSSVLQYIAEGRELLKKLLDNNFEYVIIDRTLVSTEERIMVQKVPKSIYKASYPVRVFNEKNIIELFPNNYQIIYEFKSNVDEDIDIGDIVLESKGYILKAVKE